MSEILNAGGSQVLEVQDGEPVRPGGSGALAFVDDGGCEVSGERGEVVVQVMDVLYLSESTAKVGVAGMHRDVGKLLSKVLGYSGGFGVGLGATVAGGERDGLVRGDLGPFAGETPDGAPESPYVGAMGDGGDIRSPSGSGGGLGQGIDLCI